jgi:diphthine methyl ester acylhydrolase
MCAAVSSTATVSMFSLSADEDEPLKETGTATLSMLTKGARESENGVLFLAFSWHPSRKDIIAVSTSEGGIHLVHLGGSSNEWTMPVDPVLTHSLEPWCVTIHAHLGFQEENQPFMVFSGGDDSNLFYTTCTGTPSTECDADEDELRVTHRIRGHEAGVTAILPLDSNLDPHLQLVVTGSYDDHIRLFGIGHAGLGGSRLLAESHLGGGVWRLKVVRVDKSDGSGWRITILASCMHAGVRIVGLSKSVGNIYGFRTLGSFVEHQSMNYGSDFQPGMEGDLVVVSTSFYDKLLCLWRFSGRGGKGDI